MNKVNIGAYSRSVSIIGVGCTPFMHTMENPETDGLTEGELFGAAAVAAYEDAGVTAGDIEYYIHGAALPYPFSHYATPSMQVQEWCGLRGLGGHHHSEACCTGYVALEQAALAVASGKYDVVLTGCVEMSDAIAFDISKPAHIRKRLDVGPFREDILPCIYDRAYTRPFMATKNYTLDTVSAKYERENGLTHDQMDETLIHAALSNRFNASKNPLALNQKPFEEIAKENGFDDVMAFMKSMYNPKITQYMRASGLEARADGAACVIVCATEVAHKFKGQPIEILGAGHSCWEATNANLEEKGTLEAARQIYGLTGLEPKDIDLLLTNDFIIASQLVASEATGYIPQGEAWKYIIDGRTRLSGDKPINTGGGRTSFGHAHGASGLADVCEAVWQMRGDAGEHQLEKKPETTMLRGFGGGQNILINVLRTVK